MTTLAPPAVRRRGPSRPFRSARLKSSKPRGLSPQFEQQLAERILAGDQSARDELVIANCGLARYFAAQFMSWGRHDLSFEDLAQEGAIGLVIAAERYQPILHGARFSTYAYYWIRQRIRLAIMNTGEPVRMPVYIYERRQADKRRPQIVHLAAHPIEVSVPADDHLGALIRREERDRLRHELALLTATQRELLRWYAEDYGTPGRKPGTRNERLNRRNAARKLVAKLQARLRKEGSDHV